MNDITIVTGFWNIGREEFNLYPRTNSQYLEYFKFWAKMKNKLVVYTYESMAEEVRKIRNEYGLLEQTTIITIDNPTEIMPKLYEKMVKIENQNFINEYRYVKGAVENNAKYDYVMLMKYWCMADAVKRGITTEMVAWIDFGFNHGSDCYINSNEFSFLWETELDNKKIHLFALDEISKLPIYELVRNMDVDIMGAIVIAGTEKCNEFWSIIKKQIESLVNVGFIDDDQILLLMAYREEPDIFDIHKSYWFMPLKENGANHLTTKVIENTYKPKLSDKIFKIKRRLAYIKRQYKYFK